MLTEKGALISVVVPAYNVEPFLGRCLKSLCNQTHKNLEIIVVNDGSTDKTIDVAEEYVNRDKRIKLISQNNKGLSGARNTGMKHASGDYIGFLDSDDWVPDYYYEKLLDLMMANNADVVTTDFIQVVNERCIKSMPRIRYKTIIGDEILRDYITSAVKGNASRIAVGTKLYKNTVIGDIRFEEGRIYEDIDFNWFVFKAAERIVVASGIDYYYFFNQNSITKNGFTDSVFDLVHAAEVIQNDYSGNDISIKRMIDIYRKRADFSVFVRMLKSDMQDQDMMQRQLSLVKMSFGLLFFSPLRASRKMALVLFKFLPLDTLMRLRFFYDS